MLTYRKKGNNYIIKDSTDNVAEIIDEKEFNSLQHILEIKLGKPSLEEYLAKQKLLGLKPNYLVLTNQNPRVLRIGVPPDEKFTEFPFDTSEITSFQNTFRDNIFLEEIDLTKIQFNSAQSFKKCFAGTPIKQIDFTGVYARPENLRYMFSDCTELKEFNQGDTIDLSELFTTSHMFRRCLGLRKVKLDLSKSSKLNLMQGMFCYCTSLEDFNVDRDLNLGDTQVCNISLMFVGCNSLKKVDFCRMDFSKVETMSNLFKYCSSLVEIDMSRVRNLNESVLCKDSMNMFYSCISLRRIYVGSESIKDIIKSKISPSFDVEIIVRS